MINLEINPNYVRDYDKAAILGRIISTCGKRRISFQEVKKRLKDEYGIETRTIGNFFRKQLPEYNRVGGNKKKFIVTRGQK